jgi:hypothetical protein
MVLVVDLPRMSPLAAALATTQHERRSVALRKTAHQTFDRPSTLHVVCAQLCRYTLNNSKASLA